MQFFSLVCLLVLSITGNNAFLSSKRGNLLNTTEVRVLANAKIYSNQAEIIQPLSKLPLEFSSEDWAEIRPDSITLTGTDVNVTRQTITEQKKSLQNAEVFVRSPSSSQTNTKYVKATMVDEKRNLVKIVDKDISKEPIYFTASYGDVLYDDEPPQSKYYVNFTYNTNAGVYVSYLRNTLSWKTRYQLNLFDGAKSPVLIAMADIRNDGQSKVDIDHAELLGGDINLQANRVTPIHYAYEASRSYASSGHYADSAPPPPTLSRGEEVAGMYVFAVDIPFSIDGKTNYLLPMFRPTVKVERFSLISKTLYSGTSSSSGKATRSYRLESDRFLSQGNCIIRDSDRIVGETSLPNLAAKDKHEFSIGEDADIVYKENTTLVSSRSATDTGMQKMTLGQPKLIGVHEKTKSVYDVKTTIRNLKKSRSVDVEYRQEVYGQSVKLLSSNPPLTQEGSKVIGKMTLGPDESKTISYSIEVVN